MRTGWLQELWSGMSDRHRAPLSKALDAVEQGDLRRAAAVLKAAGLYGLSAPEGPANPEDAQTERRPAKKLVKIGRFSPRSGRLLHRQTNAFRDEGSNKDGCVVVH
jgi:hypothetical protein